MNCNLEYALVKGKPVAAARERLDIITSVLAGYKAPTKPPPPSQIGIAQI
jgi:hypothetical protein